MLQDISSRSHVVHIVDTFYSKAMQDDLIGHLFEGLNLDNHLPTIHDFWENILFRTGAYKGGLMYKHFALNARKPLKAEHFKRWLELFIQTIDTSFAGENADIMKQFAYSIAQTMQDRILQAELPMAFRDAPKDG